MVNLGSLLSSLKKKTFTGEGTGHYYPPGSDTAYYKMRYSPGLFELRHKSPHGLSEERLVVKYRNDKLDIASVEYFLDGQKIERFKETRPGLFVSIDDDDSLKLLVKYLFKDPRIVLHCVEGIDNLPADKGSECVALTVLDLPFLCKTKIICELLIRIKGPKLITMRVRKFIFGKEVPTQTMDINFNY